MSATLVACEKVKEEVAAVGDDVLVSNGLFSVSDDKQVSFAESNVTFDFTDWTWGMAARPWETVTDYADSVMYAYLQLNPEVYDSAMLHRKGVVVDRFSWGTGNNPMAPILYYLENGDSSHVADWGLNFGEGWRTPTADEIRYVLYGRTDAASLRGPARVAGVNGLMLLADDWQCPHGMTFNASATAYEINTYSEADWGRLKEAGAVFLPADGWLDPDVNEEMQAAVGHYANYWLMTMANPEIGRNWAYVLEFHDYGDGFHLGNEQWESDETLICGHLYGRHFVRLVKDN